MISNLELGQDTYRELLRVARRYSRSQDEAMDLVQDAVTIALSRGYEDWSLPIRRAWLLGVVRNRAAFIIRGEQRRRRREALDDARSEGEQLRWSFRAEFLSRLPHSLRVVAALVSADLCPSEIRWLLSLSDTAWRQRLTALRRAVSAEAEPPTQHEPPAQLSLGTARAMLLAGLKRQPGKVVATHDPDGHSILLRVSPHKPTPTGNEQAKEFAHD